MNNKSKKLNKNLIAGGALVLGTVLSAASFPMLVESASNAATAADKTIYLLSANQEDIVVGNDYTIRTAFFGKNEKIPVGLDSYADTDVTASSVTVTYVSTGKRINIDRTAEGNDDAGVIAEVNAGVASGMTYGTFPVDYVGTYRINYSITVLGKTYSTSIDVKAVKEEASLGFKENQAEVLPTVYDIAYDKAKDEQGNLKAVALVLPTVYDAKEEETNVNFFTKAELDGNLIPAAETDYVVISVKDPKGADVALTKDEGKFLIPGTAFS